jgi:hypothetical protein
MGQAKQNKIDDDFSKELSSSAEELVAEMCLHTAPLGQVSKPQEKEHNNRYIQLFIWGLEAYSNGDYNKAFEHIESIRSTAVHELDDIKDHDCHLSQDSGCETCEEI